MEILINLFNEYKSIILLAGGLIILAYIVYKITEYITREANTSVIEVSNTVKLEMTVYEDGRTSMNLSYPENLKDLFKKDKKTNKNETYNDFLDSLPKEYVLTYEYQVEYITNKNEKTKRLGTTEDIDEIKKQIENLIKYN